MTAYLLLCIFAVLLTIISFGFIIGGLIKGKKSVWISSLMAFVILTLLSVSSIVLYVKKSIDYAASEEFQAETKKTASNWGKNIGNTVSGAADGLESTLDDQAIAKLAKKGGVILGSGVKAFAKGVDETLGKQAIYPDKNLEKSRIKIERAEWLVDSAKLTFGVYLEFQNDFKGSLSLTAYDDHGNKIDRSEFISHSLQVVK